MPAIVRILTIVILCFSIMEGEESLKKFSPEVVVKEVAVRSAVSLLPRIILFHGTADCSMPSAERSVKPKLLATSDFITVPTHEFLACMLNIV